MGTRSRPPKKGGRAKSAKKKKAEKVQVSVADEVVDTVEVEEAPKPRRKRKANPGVKAAKSFSPRIFGRWARAAVLAVAERELTGAAKKKAASDYVAKQVADAIPDTPTGTLIEWFAVPVARALFETAIQKVGSGDRGLIGQGWRSHACSQN